MWHKRGVLGFPIVFVSSLAFLIIILLIFATYFLAPKICISETRCYSLGGLEPQAAIAAEDITSSTSLFALLKYSSSKGDMADLIIAAQTNPQLYEELDRELTPLLQAMQPPKQFGIDHYVLLIIQKPEQKILHSINSKSSLRIPEELLPRQAAVLPLPNKEGTLLIILEHER